MSGPLALFGTSDKRSMPVEVPFLAAPLDRRRATSGDHDLGPVRLRRFVARGTPHTYSARVFNYVKAHHVLDR